MRKTSLCLILGFAALAMLATTAPRRTMAADPAEANEPGARRPNIIFILADDLGYGDLGCYGSTKIQSPHIDALAANGVKFTQMYAGCTVCTPSRYTLMTGLHNGHAWLRGNDRRNIRAVDVTVAELLKKAGYHTAMIGKWGIGEAGTEGEPRKKGFDFFFGYLDNVHAHNYYPSFLWRNETREKLKNIVPNEKSNGGGVSSNKAQYSNDLFADEAIKYLDEHKGPGGQPFFLYLPFTIPHANDEAGNRGMEVPDLGPYADKPWPEPEKGEAAMVTRLDSYVGRIMARLKELGLDDQTLVIFTSDNGPHREGGFNPSYNDAGGPLRGIKRDLYEGGIREPFIARWPGHTHPGTTCDFIGGFVDFLDTAAELAHVPSADVPKNDGISFVPSLLGENDRQPKHEYMYWEFHEGTPQQAVRAGDWKAVRKPMETGKTELFDLKTDLGEKHDVSAEHPAIVKKLDAMMDEAHTPWPPAKEAPAHRAGAAGAAKP